MCRLDKRGGRGSPALAKANLILEFFQIIFSTQFYFYHLKFLLRQIFLRIQLRGANYLLRLLYFRNKQNAYQIYF